MRVPRCSIIIRAYNEEKHIGRLLTGILEQTISDTEVIVVDSGSQDATTAIAARYPVRLVRIAPEEFSFGRSLNRGCAAARGELLVLASAHVHPVYPDWLEQLLLPFRDPGIALVYGRQRGDAGTRFSEQQILAKWFPDTSVERQSIAFCNNANAAIRADLWRQRPYDESLPGLEDLEWATWALTAGHGLAYRAEAEVVHVHEELPPAVFNRYRREAMALKRIHPQEHFHLWDFLRLYVGNVSSDLAHAARQRVLRREWWGIVWFRWMQFAGTYQGFSRPGLLTGELKQAFYYPRGLRAMAEGRRNGVRPIAYAQPAESPSKEAE